MLTPNESRSFRARIGLSQRRAAIEAGVSRTYLNQFESGRWNPTAEFLGKLESFYAQYHVVSTNDLTETEPHTSRLREAYPEPQCEVGTCPNTLSSENDGDDELSWRTVGKTALIIGVIGSILAATGNVRGAAAVFTRFATGMRSRGPLGS